MTADERRAQLIDSAIALFGRNGFSGTTTKSLALAAGVSEATIFKHFPTKADLYAAAFDRRAGGVGTEKFVVELQCLADRGDDEELLRCIVKAVLWGYERDRDMHRMLQFVWLEQDASANTSLASQMQKHSVVSFLVDYIAQRQREGVFAPGPALLLANTLTALPAEPAVRTKLYGVEAAHTDDQVTEALARFMLAGLRGGMPAAATLRDGQ